MLAAPIRSRQMVIGLAVAMLIAVAVFAYAPGLHGVFVFDSVERVVRSQSLPISAPDAEQLPGYFRATLELSMAKILASAGKLDPAVGHAQWAGEVAADNLEYRLQEAILYALLGRWEELLKVLDEVENRFPDRVDADSRFQDLRRQYKSASNNALSVSR